MLGVCSRCCDRIPRTSTSDQRSQVQPQLFRLRNDPPSPLTLCVCVSRGVSWVVFSVGSIQLASTLSLLIDSGSSSHSTAFNSFNLLSLFGVIWRSSPPTTFFFQTISRLLGEFSASHCLQRCPGPRPTHAQSTRTRTAGVTVWLHSLVVYLSVGSYSCGQQYVHAFHCPSHSTVHSHIVSLTISRGSSALDTR